ncbi:MAG TPA: hypothetical protein PK079_06740 [Leptospiraceae bacterium]|nr:hypothetical protein [Leptospiraceae bacterium]HMW06993.1 hypothetical protein [Leptospiraceae bacterium]HMX32662.1 hypothetical protein [Leptospiraceae bacterium]HMY30359.1 hypothetical protein [Leptospiraceae bacterium]HMZ65873.1 hypothetical protein [Leptospiraceae bacterium]
MAEFPHIEASNADSLEEMGTFFFKSLNDFILFTSGYYQMVENPPKAILPVLDNPDFIVEVAALETAAVSFITSLFQGRLMIPALAIEYFLNNRIQSEMIFSLLKEKGVVPDEDTFLRCLSGIDPDNHSFLQVNDKMANGIIAGSALFARESIYKKFITLIETTPLGQMSITQNALNTLLSALTSYLETRSIAIATSNIYQLHEGK